MSLDKNQYLEQIAHPESRGKYDALGPTGKGMLGPAMGKYQFTQKTLNGLVDKYGHPELEKLSGQERFDYFLSNPALQEEMAHLLIRDQQDTIKRLGGDPNDPVALGIAHRAGTGKKLRDYIAGRLDPNEKIDDGAGLDETIGEWLGKAGLSPAAAPAQQEPPQMANLGPMQQPLMPAEAGGMGAQFASPPFNPQGGGVPPGIDFLRSPGLQMQGFNLPPMGAFPQPQAESIPGRVTGVEPPGVPPMPPEEPLTGGPAGPQGMGMLAQRFGNAMLPGQPFNPEGLAMSEGLGNMFTSGKRGDSMSDRRERRIQKALEKAARLKARGKDKKAARKERKAERLESGERVGAMRWLFGK